MALVGGAAQADPPRPESIQRAQDLGQASQAPPVIFNAAVAARGGDLVSLQGYNFGRHPVVEMQGASPAEDRVLPLVNRLGDWVSVKIPPTVSGAIRLRVINEAAASAVISLNGVKAYHLDSLRIVPGGIFRIFGKNLERPDKPPKVTVGGITAKVETDKSDGEMLTVFAPENLPAQPSATITVDNGDGSGPVMVERTLEVVGRAAVAPFGQIVGWSAHFAPLMGRMVEIPCNGQEVSGLIQAAIDELTIPGGGVVQLSAGACAVGKSIAMRSNIVLQGQGEWMTILHYMASNPILATNVTGIAVRNLTLANVGTAQEGPLIKSSQLVVLENLQIDLGTQQHSFFDDNRNILVTGCIFNQSSSSGSQSSYLFDGSRGLVFSGNTTNLIAGGASFGRVSDAYIEGNTFIRDSRAQNQPGTLHMLTLDFASRIAVVNNVFKAANGTILSKTRNDGESLLTEGGGPNRTENIGLVAAATADTLYDPALTLDVDPFHEGRLPQNYGIAIVAGRGTGQTRYVIGFAGGT